MAKQKESVVPAASNLVAIHVCCNHYRNGMFDGKLRAVEFPGLTLYLSGRVPRIEFVGETLMKISKRNFTIVGTHSWVGNWCWDAVTMEKSRAVQLFRWLATKPWFSPESGQERMWKWWDRLQKQSNNAAGE